MTVIFYPYDESELQTTETTWQTALEASGDLEAGEEGEHIIHVYCEITGSATNRAVAARVMLNGVERAFDSKQPLVADQYMACSFMGLANLPIGSNTIQLQYISENQQQTAKIRRRRILVIKH